MLLVVLCRPAVIAHALALGWLGFPVNHALQGVVCQGGFPSFSLPQASLLGVGVFGYGFGLFGGSVAYCVSRARTAAFLKIIPIFRAVIGFVLSSFFLNQPKALLDSYCPPAAKGRKLVKAPAWESACRLVVRRSYRIINFFWWAWSAVLRLL